CNGLRPAFLDAPFRWRAIRLRKPFYLGALWLRHFESIQRRARRNLSFPSDPANRTVHIETGDAAEDRIAGDPRRSTNLRQTSWDGCKIGSVRLRDKRERRKGRQDQAVAHQV